MGYGYRFKCADCGVINKIATWSKYDILVIAIAAVFSILALSGCSSTTTNSERPTPNELLQQRQQETEKSVQQKLDDLLQKSTRDLKEHDEFMKKSEETLQSLMSAYPVPSLNGWKVYGNDGVVHSSGVAYYYLCKNGNGESGIWVLFADGNAYLYTPSSCGAEHFESLCTLAQQGEGLTTYFGNNHDIGYQSKHSESIPNLNARNNYSQGSSSYDYIEVECEECGSVFEVEIEYEDGLTGFCEVECDVCGSMFEVEFDLN